MKIVRLRKTNGFITFDFQFHFPNWVFKFLLYAFIFVLGATAGLTVTMGLVSADEESAYNAGFVEGENKCKEPSKLQKGTKAFADWLSSP